MFKTSYQDIEYCFYDDYMTVAGAPMRYSEMVDITHKGGQVPSFAFTYGDRRFTIPYDPADRSMITPFFVRAHKTPSQFASEEREPVQPAEYTEPEAATEYVEQPQAEEYVEPAEYAEPEAATEYVEQPQAEEYVEPAEYTEPEEYVEPAEYAEPEAATEYVEQPQAEEYVEPAEYTEPEAATEYVEQPQAEEYVEPAEYTEPVQAEEYVEQPQAVPEKTGFMSKVKSLPAGFGGLPRRNKLIIAIIAAVVIAAIVLFAVFGGFGKSIEGIDGRIDSKEVKNTAGDTMTVSVIESDTGVEEYATSYCEEMLNDKNSIHWIFNEKTNETVLFSNQDGVVLVCSFDSVDGEKDDPDLYGSGTLKDTWIYYSDTEELVKI